MRAATTLRPDRESARVARRFVSSTLTRWKCEHVADMVALLTSELVTNAVVHTGSPVELSLRLAERTIRVEVADRGDGRPARRPAAPDATSGRGLSLVDSLAARWGVIESRSGKSVWFEVAT